MFNHHSPIPWGSFRGRQEEKWGSFRGPFGGHFRVGDHFGVGIISGAVQYATANKVWLKVMSHSQNHFKLFVFLIFICIISFSLYYIKQSTISPIYYNYKPLKSPHSFFLQQSTNFLHTNQVKKILCFSCSFLFSSKVILPGCFCLCPKFAWAKLYLITLCHVS